ncbi:hypothetical protein EGI22_02645 [Lacihabitans sp. LS3-19]|nr:hypothetical protein [Lacihabitans sp. LS3-19]
MYLKIILFLILLVPFENFANENLVKQNMQKVDKPRKNKQGRYKVKKHRLKKLIQGKRYCDCPKH